MIRFIISRIFNSKISLIVSLIFLLLITNLIPWQSGYAKTQLRDRAYAWNEDLIDIIAELGSEGGGVRASRDERHGYFVVAVSYYSAKGDVTEAYEAARLEALKELAQFINGVEVSGQTKMKSGEKYHNNNGQENTSIVEEFVSVTKTYFKGNISGAQTWKKGLKGKKVYIVLLLDEKSLKQRAMLKQMGAADGTQSSNSAGSYYTGADNKSMAGPSSSNREEVVTVTGVAPMKGGSTAAARQEAIRDALRNAVQQVNGVIIQGRAGRWGKHISNAISSRTEGYISSYKILQEGARYGNFEVKIKAVVNRSALVRDVDIYLEALGSPTFRINAPKKYYHWLAGELKKVGFAIIGSNGTATHEFRINIIQNEVPNPGGGPSGYSTEIAIDLTDLASRENLFTIRNNPQRTQIYLSSRDTAKAASEKAAMKQLKKKMVPEIVNALAQRSRSGQIYHIKIINANRKDYSIFKHCLESGSEGRVVSWDWNAKNKVLTLKYKFPGSLSQAFDGVMHQLYDTYKLEGKKRKPRAKQIGTHEAVFEIIKS